MLPAASLDAVFHALADPTRRAVIAQLGAGPAAVSTLAAPFDMTLPSFSAHLRVLEDSGLVRSQKVGRVRTYHLAPRRLRVAQSWLARQHELWTRRLDQLDQHLTTLTEQSS